MRRSNKLTRLIGETNIARPLSRLPLWNGLLTFNYHRIGDWSQSPYDRELYSASEDVFRRQIRLLSDRFQIVTPADLPQLVESPRGRYAMITFDDGYRDNYELAARVMREEGVRGTFFIATGLIDHPKLPWWDRVAYMARTSEREETTKADWLPERLSLREGDVDLAIRKLLRIYKRTPGEELPELLQSMSDVMDTPLPDEDAGREMWMTWDMIRELQSEGFEIGGHTANHPVLANLAPEEQHREIEECRRRLDEELPVSPRSFSYPVGGPDAFNEVTRAALADHGFTSGFSYYGGYASLENLDWYDIPRVAVNYYTTTGEVGNAAALPQIFS